MVSPVGGAGSDTQGLRHRQVVYPGPQASPVAGFLLWYCMCVICLFLHCNGQDENTSPATTLPGPSGSPAECPSLTTVAESED